MIKLNIKNPQSFGQLLKKGAKNFPLFKEEGPRSGGRFKILATKSKINSLIILD
jgi:hypothetical protein